MNLKTLLPGVLVLAACGGRTRVAPSPHAPVRSAHAAESRSSLPAPAASAAAAADQAEEGPINLAVLDTGDLLDIAYQSLSDTQERLHSLVAESLNESCGELSGLPAQFGLLQAMGTYFVHTAPAGQRVTYTLAMQKMASVGTVVGRLHEAVCGTGRVTRESFRLVDGSPDQTIVSLAAAPSFLRILDEGPTPFQPAVFAGNAQHQIKVVMNHALPRIRSALEAGVARVQEQHRRDGDAELNSRSLHADVRECSSVIQAEAIVRTTIGLLSDGRAYSDVLPSDIAADGTPLNHFAGIPQDSLLAAAPAQVAALLQNLNSDLHVHSRSAACRGTREAMVGVDAASDHRGALTKLSALESAVAALH